MVLMKLFERQQWRHRQREQTHGHEARGIGEEGEGGMDGKNNMETFITVCK